jgi:hypothetical protein
MVAAAESAAVWVVAPGEGLFPCGPKTAILATTNC